MALITSEGKWLLSVTATLVAFVIAVTQYQVNALKQHLEIADEYVLQQAKGYSDKNREGRFTFKDFDRFTKRRDDEINKMAEQLVNLRAQQAQTLKALRSLAAASSKIDDLVKQVVMKQDDIKERLVVAKTPRYERDNVCPKTMKIVSEGS